MAGKRAWLYPAVWMGSTLPFVVILLRATTGRLGANPIATALNQVGLLALIFLLASLACTPLKAMFGWTWQMQLRKTLGLFGFFAALLHFLVYVAIDQGLDFGIVMEDVAKRPFIAVGFTALLLLVPLAVTSTKSAPKRLGFATWKKLHRLAYVCAGLGVVHYFLRVKADVTEPLVYGGVLSYLLFARAVGALRQGRKRAARGA